MKTLRSVMLAGVVGCSALLAAGTASAFWGGGGPMNWGGWNSGWGGPGGWGGPMSWGGGYPGYGWGGGYPGYGGYGGGYPYYGGYNYGSAPYSGGYDYPSGSTTYPGSKPAEPSTRKSADYPAAMPPAK